MNAEPQVRGRCGKVHTCGPVDPDKIMRELAEEMRREIDADILREISERAGSS